MKPVLKNIYSVDIPTNLVSWTPSNIDDIYILIEMDIGLQNQDGGDIFSLIIATTKALEAKNNGFVLAGRGHLIVRQWIWSEIIVYIENILNEIQGNTWSEVTLKLTRHFFWEYEDMNKN